MDAEQAKRTRVLELHAAILRLVRRYQSMGLEMEEFVMLKAIALANSGTNTRSVEMKPGSDIMTVVSCRIRYNHVAAAQCRSLSNAEEGQGLEMIFIKRQNGTAGKCPHRVPLFCQPRT